MKLPPRGPFSRSPPGGPHGSTPIRIVRLASVNLERIAYAFSLRALASSSFPRRNLRRVGSTRRGGKGRREDGNCLTGCFRPPDNDRSCGLLVKAEQRPLNALFNLKRPLPKSGIGKTCHAKRGQIAKRAKSRSILFAVDKSFIYGWGVCAPAILAAFLLLRFEAS